MSSQSSLQHKLDKLKSFLAGYGKAGLAFSGGADSSLLLKAAVEVLGDNVIAMHACSFLHPETEQQHVMQMADEIGCQLRLVEIHPLQFEIFISNPADRCYHCKKIIYQKFYEILADQDVDILFDGSNLDDLHDDRPGLKALAEMKVVTPLAAVGLYKSDVRRISRNLGLSTWNRYSASCLATRIPAGIKIDVNKLRFIEKAENILHELGFHGCRVRFDGVQAIIEIIAEDFERIQQPLVRDSIVAGFAALGMQRVLFDLRERRVK